MVSVPLVLASRRTGVTRYPALWSADFPRTWRDSLVCLISAPRNLNPQHLRSDRKGAGINARGTSDRSDRVRGDRPRMSALLGAE